MSEKPWTEGPWTKGPLGGVERKDDSEVVCFRSVTTLAAGSEQKIAEAEANTVLIATAPELYDELADRLAQTRCGCGHPACKLCEADAETERVLAKARGEGQG